MGKIKILKPTIALSKVEWPFLTNVSKGGYFVQFPLPSIPSEPYFGKFLKIRHAIKPIFLKLYVLPNQFLKNYIFTSSFEYCLHVVYIYLYVKTYKQI